MPEFAPVLVVSALNGTNGFRLDGDATQDYSGRAVAGGADVNGDGFADLLIGAPRADLGGTDRGLAWVVFGAATAPAAQKLGARVAAGTAYRFQGEAALDRAGYSVRSAGDVNGDGFDDFVIGARSADPDAALSDRGATYLVFGGVAKLEALDATDAANDNLCALANLAPATGFRFDGGSDNDSSGWSVSGAGDVNGDGFGDLLIGAPYAEPNGGYNEGAAYIVFGGGNLADLDDDDGTADGRIDLALVSGGKGLRLDGATTYGGNTTGRWVSQAGDVNGDGIDDVIVGARYADPTGVNNSEGAAYVVFGRPQAAFTLATFELSGLNGIQGTRLDGVAAGDFAGAAVAGLGDVNGDGFDDVAVGARSADTPAMSSGAAYVVFGRSAWGPSHDLQALDGSNGFRLAGLRGNDFTGAAVSAAGDVNGDGFADILVSAYRFDTVAAYGIGAAYVVFGKASGFAADIDLGTLDGDDGFRIEGVTSYGALGFGIQGAAGDVNGDGFDDILVSDDSGNNGLLGSGSTYIIYGHRAETAVTRVGTHLDNTINGGKGDDTISGLSGNDALFGWENDDIINGGDGNDKIDGGAGEDTFNGGGGADTMLGGADADAFHGGSGGDTVSYDYEGITARIRLALDGSFAAEGDAALDSFVSIERITGTDFGDVIRGNRFDNRLIGGFGNDTLQGQDGNDSLLGGMGAEALTGGLGDDFFDYTSTSHGGDTVQDFSNASGNNDSFRFSGSAFGGLPPGTLAANRFLANTTGAATNTTQRFIYETDTGILRYDSNGTGAGGVTVMATLTGAPALTVADFLII